MARVVMTSEDLRKSEEPLPVYTADIAPWGDCAEMYMLKHTVGSGIFISRSASPTYMRDARMVPSWRLAHNLMFWSRG